MKTVRIVLENGHHVEIEPQKTLVHFCRYQCNTAREMKLGEYLETSDGISPIVKIEIGEAGEE